jgi:hypothetical protein
MPMTKRVGQRRKTPVQFVIHPAKLPPALQLIRGQAI